MRATPLVWISVGLVGLTLSVMLAGDSLVNLVPNHDRQIFEYRRTIAESLAIQYSVLAERDQVEIIKFGMETLAGRNRDILSLALLQRDGEVVAKVGEHAQVWVQPPGGESTLQFLQVPIFAGNQQWGVLQIAFRQTGATGLDWFLTDPWVRFLAFVSVTAFFGYLFFMKRTLRQLDPSGVVPTRVKAALDALSQGVVMIDAQDLIVLTNDSFSRAVNKPVTSLIGTDLGALGWTSATPSDSLMVHPWTKAVMDRQPLDHIPLLLNLPDSEQRRFIVNTVPIIDDGSTVRGALVSFHDVTELDRANSQLKEANSELEASRIQILEKNLELEVTNTNLHVEMDQRKKAEAEKEKLYQQLMNASRQAGMADVASSVLHNVGNVLNSINVSTDTLLKTLKKPMVGDVCRIASLFHEHQNNLQEFLTADPKGKQIPSYLGLVAESLSGSHQAIQGELDSLVKKVDHIKQAIMSQQDIARAGNIREPVSVEDLMEQAVLMALPEPEKYQIRLVREYHAVSTIMTDRHQVLQVLVNLITNAKNAMVEHSGGTRCLTLRIGVSSAKTFAQFEVIDTGGGIKQEHLPRLFAQGFTTRKAGHGLGLHSAAIAAKNLGGTLRAQSAGEGCGATFTLELPLIVVEAAA
ncbi:ATP-binding protein [Candidatus Nitrospira nitrificans]|uniref:histidine kinase n=1 Tax=Candidatus Nitrospira nitrificans TaxID=1742973 RepID=A0A0S4LNU0_9BACT|nr:ATP-binding protein [Candidatus Nitrospira nitrificans]CUS39255.1 putative Histidine kinase [Candidatus Nitrospira nitrificans]